MEASEDDPVDRDAWRLFLRQKTLLRYMILHLIINSRFSGWECFFFTQLGAGCIMCSTELSRLCMDASLDDLVDNNAWRLLLRQRSCCLIYLQNHLPAWPIPAPSVFAACVSAGSQLSQCTNIT